MKLYRYLKDPTTRTLGSSTHVSCSAINTNQIIDFL